MKKLTPKEQAVILVQQFCPIVNGGESYSFVLDKAKKCALISIDKIIKYLQHKWETVGSSEFLLDRNEQMEIRKEIEAL
jgi:predicted proteasome-type protease